MRRFKAGLYLFVLLFAFVSIAEPQDKMAAQPTTGTEEMGVYEKIFKLIHDEGLYAGCLKCRNLWETAFDEVQNGSNEWDNLIDSYAACLMKDHREAEAVNLLQEAIKISPKNFRFLAQIGTAYMRIRAIDPRGSVTEYGYDEHGNLIRKTEAVRTDSEGVSTYTYDEYGYLATVTIEANAGTEAAATTFTYDDDGNLASITDPEGNITEFLDYDIMGNPIQIKDPRGYTWAFTYDDMGRLITRTDGMGNTTAFEYDEANNRTTEPPSSTPTLADCAFAVIIPLKMKNVKVAVASYLGLVCGHVSSQQDRFRIANLVACFYINVA